MNIKADRSPSIAELTTAQPSETDPAYEAWLRGRIERAIQRDRANPEERASGEAVRKHFARRFAADR